MTKTISIRRNLLMVVTAALGVLLLSAALLLDHFIDIELQARFDGELLAVAHSLQTLTLQETKGVELHFSDEVMTNFSSLEKPYYFELLDKNGRLLERSNSLRRMNARLQVTDAKAAIQWTTLPDKTRGRLVNLQFTPGFGDTLDKRLKITDLATTQQNPAAELAHVSLRVARTQAPLDRTAVNIDLALMAAVFMVLFGTAALIWWRVGRELDVIDIIAARTERDALLLNTSAIALDGVPKELSRFVDSVNRSTRALAGALEREQRWSRDLAHELRTPIAELRTLLDVSISFPELHNPTTVQVQARAIAIEMDSLVSSLLLMSRVESATEQICLRAVDLHSLLADLMASQSDWRLDVPAPFWIRSDQRLLKIVLSNLINNAIAYAEPSNSVRISIIAAANEGFAALEICNGAPTLTPDDLSDMHRRFWRKPGRTDAAAHSGLGLSIAYAVCEMLKLKVNLHLSDQQVLSVRVDHLERVRTSEIDILISAYQSNTEPFSARHPRASG